MSSTLPSLAAIARTTARPLVVEICCNNRFRNDKPEALPLLVVS